MTKLVATSVVRGSHQGESHGGVYLVDFAQQSIEQVVDWNTTNIDWQGRGWDRGLRGIAFDGERVFIAASNELFVYTPDFELLDSYTNPFLMHCHEIAVHKRRLYLSSTGFDSVLGFDLDNNCFCSGFTVARDEEGGFRGIPFDPRAESGPMPANVLHLNNVYCDASGLYLSGLNTGALIVYKGRTLEQVAAMPRGLHNARPFGDGVLFNDTVANQVRLVTPKQEISFPVPHWDKQDMTHTDLDDSRVARACFGRGLCVVDEATVAAGSSPSTIALHDLALGRTREVVALSRDMRNAIHGLEVWPFG